MLIVQSEFSLGSIKSGLLDLVHDGAVSVRICFADVSTEDSETPFDAVVRAPLTFVELRQRVVTCDLPLKLLPMI